MQKWKDSRVEFEDASDESATTFAEAIDEGNQALAETYVNVALMARRASANSDYHATMDALELVEKLEALGIPGYVVLGDET